MKQLLAGTCIAFAVMAAPAVAQTALPSPASTAVQQVKVSPAKLAAFKAAVADEMKDPQSAQFRGLITVMNAKGEEGLCGSINAKNSYGAYAGFEPFYAFELMVKPNKAVAVVSFSSRVGMNYVNKACGY